MSTIEESIEVQAPLMHWVAEFGGSHHEWDAEVTEQKPDERVAWKATTGLENAGVVTFHRIDEDNTKVMVQMDFAPDGIKEKIGDAIGAPAHPSRATSVASRR